MEGVFFEKIFFTVRFELDLPEKVGVALLKRYGLVYGVS